MDEKATLTLPEAVELGAKLFDKWEQYANEIKNDARGDMRRVFDAANQAGHLGGIESIAIGREIEALATQFEADLYQLHADLTERAKKAGVDLPAPRSGGR